MLFAWFYAERGFEPLIMMLIGLEGFLLWLVNKNQKATMPAIAIAFVICAGGLFLIFQRNGTTLEPSGNNSENSELTEISPTALMKTKIFPTLTSIPPQTSAPPTEVISTPTAANAPRPPTSTQPITRPSSQCDEQVLDWQSIDGTWTVEQGIITGMTSDQPNLWKEGRYIASPGTTWEEYTYHGEIKFDSSQHYEIALLFHVQDAWAGSYQDQDNGRYYQISLYADRDFDNVILWEVFDGSNGLVRLNYPIRSGQWYRFRIEVEDAQVTFFLDNQRVLNFSGLTRYQNGGVGIKTFLATIGHFRDLHLSLKC